MQQIQIVRNGNECQGIDLFNTRTSRNDVAANSIV